MHDKYAIPRLDFGPELVATLFEIERLRADIGTGTTPYDTYVELHRLFDVVMSVVSARIEGNHTTVYDAIEQVGSGATTYEDHFREIANIAETARFIDQIDPRAPLSHSFVRELHRRTVDELLREGDPHPGAYREVEVAITGSAHVPPSWVTVHAEMTSLLEFANAPRPLHEQMLQIAIAHHRFVWIHPFQNGNGRVSRLFTYAMLRKTIFATRGCSALKPTAVFGNQREAYIAALERGVVKAGDLGPTLQGTASARSRARRSLLDRRILQHAEEGPRFYRLSLSRGPLAPRLIRRLDALGYLPSMLSDD